MPKGLRKTRKGFFIRILYSVFFFGVVRTNILLFILLKQILLSKKFYQTVDVPYSSLFSDFCLLGSAGKIS